MTLAAKYHEAMERIQLTAEAKARILAHVSQAFTGRGDGSRPLKKSAQSSQNMVSWKHPENKEGAGDAQNGKPGTSTQFIQHAVR